MLTHYARHYDTVKKLSIGNGECLVIGLDERLLQLTQSNQEIANMRTRVPSIILLHKRVEFSTALSIETLCVFADRKPMPIFTQVKHDFTTH